MVWWRKWTVVILILVGAIFWHFSDGQKDEPVLASELGKMPGFSSKISARVDPLRMAASVSKPISPGNDPENLSEDKKEALSNPFVNEARKNTKGTNEIIKSLRSERRMSLSLPVVGAQSWFLFSDLYVDTKNLNGSLFSLGPYHIYRKTEAFIGKTMNLIFDENQEMLAVITGRVVVVLKDISEVNSVIRDYHLKLDTLSVEIKTAYLDSLADANLAELNHSLKQDSRVENFYFEIVKNQWVKN